MTLNNNMEEAKDWSSMVRNVSRVNFQTKHLHLKGVQSGLTVEYKEAANSHAK